MAEPDVGSPVLLHDVLSPPARAPPGAIRTQEERVVSTAALTQRKCRYRESGRKMADDAGE
jgi:hypothetical protein